MLVPAFFVASFFVWFVMATNLLSADSSASQVLVDEVVVVLAERGRPLRVDAVLDAACTRHLESGREISFQ